MMWRSSAKGLSGRPFFCVLMLAVLVILFGFVQILNAEPQEPNVLAQSPHDHDKVGWVPKEILERPVALRQGIGNLHEQVTTTSPQAQAFYDQGLNYQHAYEWIEAARAYHQAANLDPSLAMAYVGLSAVHLAILDTDGAVKASEQAIARSGNASPIERTRIAICAAQMEYLRDLSPDLQKYFTLRKMISDAVAETPDDPWLWILRAFADEQTANGHGQGGGADTIAFYETALTHSPDNSAAHHYLAHTFENLGRTQEALQQSEAFVKLAPSIPHAHHMRGHELMRLGRTSESIDEFLKADALENAYYTAEKIPGTYDWHHAHNLSLLALGYESLGQMKKAESAFREAFSLPVYTDIAEFNRREWVDFLMDRGRYDEAVKASQAMLERSGTAMGRFAAHALSGSALLSLNRLPDAESELRLSEEELSHVPTSVLSSLSNAGLLRSEILLRQERWPEADAAVRQIQQTILQRTGPDSWMETVFELQLIADAAKSAGDWPLAEYTAKQMVEQNAYYAGGYYILGEVAEHAGDAATARENFKKACELWANADGDLPELTMARKKVGLSD